MSDNIGSIIQQQRVLIPLTLRELSLKSGVSSSHLGRIERGERYPSANVLHKIAKPLGFEEEYLFVAAGYMSPKDETKETLESPGRLDPYVARVLSQEPVKTQQAVVAILTIIKAIAKQ